MITSRYQRRKFNPFNLPDQYNGKEKRIKFARVVKRREKRTGWLLIIVFIIVLILYYYLKL
jgi:nicotinamide riboside transporter PnuC